MLKLLRINVAFMLFLLFIFNVNCQPSINNIEFNPIEFKSICEGISDFEVIKLLGKPHEDYEVSGSHYLFWKNNDRYYWIHASNDKTIDEYRGPIDLIEYSEIRKLIDEKRQFAGIWRVISIEVNGVNRQFEKNISYQFTSNRLFICDTKKLIAFTHPYRIDIFKKAITNNLGEVFCNYELNKDELKLDYPKDATVNSKLNFIVSDRLTNIYLVKKQEN